MKYVLASAAALGFAALSVGAYTHSLTLTSIGIVLFFGSLLVESVRKEEK